MSNDPYCPERNNPSNVNYFPSPPVPPNLYGWEIKDFKLKELEALIRYYGCGRKHMSGRSKKEMFRNLLGIFQRIPSKPSKSEFFDHICALGLSTLGEGAGSQQGSHRQPAATQETSISLLSRTGKPGSVEPVPFNSGFLPDQEIAKCLRKSLLQFHYQRLERAPIWCIIQPIQPGIIPNLVSQERGGTKYPCRGRGPVAGNVNDFEAIDCVIVAGNLLDAGLTKADRGIDSQWDSRLSEPERIFLRLVSKNWEELSDYSFMDPLKRMFITHLRGYSWGGVSAVRWVWENCAKSFSQFLVQYSQNPQHERPCKQSAAERRPWSSCYVPLQICSKENTIQAQLANFFERPYHTECSGCGEDVKVSRNFESLPLRLALATDACAPPTAHTASAITINYQDLKNNTQSTVYRWLGGIYPVKMGGSFRYRVFWNDHERHETDNGKIRMYDGHQLEGKIIGGICTTDSSERVPLSWWEGHSALLFYERVLFPARPYLHAARRAIEKIIQSVEHNEVYRAPATSLTSSRPSLSTGQTQSGLATSSGTYFTNVNIPLEPPSPRKSSTQDSVQAAVPPRFSFGPQLQRITSQHQRRMGLPPSSLGTVRYTMDGRGRRSGAVEYPGVRQQMHPSASQRPQRNVHIRGVQGSNRVQQLPTSRYPASYLPVPSQKTPYQPTSPQRAPYQLLHHQPLHSKPAHHRPAALQPAAPQQARPQPMQVIQPPSSAFQSANQGGHVIVPGLDSSASNPQIVSTPGIAIPENLPLNAFDDAFKLLGKPQLTNFSGQNLPLPSAPESVNQQYNPATAEQSLNPFPQGPEPDGPYAPTSSGKPVAITLPEPPSFVSAQPQRQNTFPVNKDQTIDPRLLELNNPYFANYIASFGRDPGHIDDQPSQNTSEVPTVNPEQISENNPLVQRYYEVAFDEPGLQPSQPAVQDGASNPPLQMQPDNSAWKYSETYQYLEQNDSSRKRKQAPEYEEVIFEESGEP
ncbi:uncharacterized protein PADG_06321 [Paracoccidioides brasiliensis Pb18]|uniref:Uncharacterized protein n=1 Tax=Paracoccidioides brasiliensis (strain Pb18) TaxID=502780 RepID=C1GG84_PARBD|nr:uncharacterized protein PADG_06321 [Paracoccidioides brasiliensis Pb18]EEH50242.1 hypothetical protein PADG_06321 [Paracoccidioides brasiliensis Pb18]